jgi:hypothetical protein
MKYINKKLLLGIIISIVSVFTSCQSRLDIEPQDFITESKAFLSLADCDNNLGVAYSPLRGGGSYYPIIFDMMTEELKETVPSSLGNYRALSDWYYEADNTIINSAWNLNYVSIMRANLVLDNVDKFASSDPVLANSIKGQALALRAYAHFDLLRVFGQSYDRNSNALAVPIIRTQGDPTIQPARNTVKEVYDAIFQDLLQAKAFLANISDIPVHRLSRRAVDALLARVSLYAGQWSDAVTYSTQVINAGSNLATGTGTNSGFGDIWRRDVYTTAGNNEVIWVIPYISTAEGALASYVINFSGGAYRHSYVPTTDLKNLYSPGDIRRTEYIATLSGVEGVRKFIGRNGLTDGVVNHKAIRLGEIYLIRAEAQFKLGNTTDALNDLNTLRAARGVANLTNVNLEANIRAERRRELAFEGHRWFDIRRYNQGITRNDWGPPSIAQSLPVGSPKFVLPIPQAEMTANSKMVQNPGY